MTPPLDWLDAVSDPRVVAVVLAKDYLHDAGVIGTGVSVDYAVRLRERYGIAATEGQARALLDAVTAWDATLDHEPDCVAQICVDEMALRHGHLDAAVTAIVGKQP